MPAAARGERVLHVPLIDKMLHMYNLGDAL